MLSYIFVWNLNYLASVKAYFFRSCGLSDVDDFLIYVHYFEAFLFNALIHLGDSQWRFGRQLDCYLFTKRYSRYLSIIL